MNILIDKMEEIDMHEEMSEEEILGQYAYNKTWNIVGIVNDITKRGVVIGNNYYSTITGDCFYDSLNINGFKLYKINEEKELDCW